MLALTLDELDGDEYEPSDDELDHYDAAYESFVEDQACQAVRDAWRELGGGAPLPAHVEKAAAEELLNGGGDVQARPTRASSRTRHARPSEMRGASSAAARRCPRTSRRQRRRSS